METNRISGRAVRLAKNAAMPLRSDRGSTVWCRSGEVWITQDGDLRDIVLQPGGSFRIDADRALVSGLTAAEIVVQPVTHGRPVQAAALWLQGRMRAAAGLLSPVAHRARRAADADQADPCRAA